MGYNQGIGQFGRSLALEARSRKFKSCYPDNVTNLLCHQQHSPLPRTVLPVVTKEANAQMMKLVDMPDSESGAFKSVWVQVPF